MQKNSVAILVLILAISFVLVYDSNIAGSATKLKTNLNTAVQTINLEKNVIETIGFYVFPENPEITTVEELLGDYCNEDVQVNLVGMSGSALCIYSTNINKYVFVGSLEYITPEDGFTITLKNPETLTITIEGVRVNNSKIAELKTGANEIHFLWDDTDAINIKEVFPENFLNAHVSSISLAHYGANPILNCEEFSEEDCLSPNCGFTQECNGIGVMFCSEFYQEGFGCPREYDCVLVLNEITQEQECTGELLGVMCEEYTVEECSSFLDIIMPCNIDSSCESTPKNYLVWNNPFMNPEEITTLETMEMGKAFWINIEGYSDMQLFMNPKDGLFEVATCCDSSACTYNSEANYCNPNACDYENYCGGDVNGDGDITEEDVLFLGGGVLHPEKFTYEEFNAGDVDNDQILTNSDIMIIVNMILNNEDTEQKIIE